MVRLGGRGVPRKSAKDGAGFTLIELVVTVLILAILITVGVPSFSDATLGSRLGSYANELMTSAYLARSEAMKRNRPVTLCTSTNGTSCAVSGGWEQGWIVLEASTSTVIQHQQARAPGYKVMAKDASNAAIYSVAFQPTGFGATQATFTVCRYLPQAGKQERVVTLSPTGKPAVSRTETGTCS